MPGEILLIYILHVFVHYIIHINLSFYIWNYRYISVFLYIRYVYNTWWWPFLLISCSVAALL